MERKRDFGLSKKCFGGDLEVEKLIRAMRANNRFQKNQHATLNEGDTDEIQDIGSDHRSWKSKITCDASEFGNGSSSNSFQDVISWGEAQPLFDGEEPSDVKEEEFDKIIYSKMAQFTKTKPNNSQNSDGKSCNSAEFPITLRNFNEFSKPVFRMILLGLFIFLCYVLYDVGVRTIL